MDDFRKALNIKPLSAFSKRINRLTHRGGRPPLTGLAKDIQNVAAICLVIVTFLCIGVLILNVVGSIGTAVESGIHSSFQRSDEEYCAHHECVTVIDKYGNTYQNMPKVKPPVVQNNTEIPLDGR